MLSRAGMEIELEKRREMREIIEYYCATCKRKSHR